MWHKAVATIFTRTSPGPGGDTVTVVTSNFFFASQAIAALHSIGFPAVAAKSAMALTRTTALRGADLLGDTFLRSADDGLMLTAQEVAPTDGLDARASIAEYGNVNALSRYI